ncbi:hypothetical protein [Hyphococcus sp.]|uniref:hypothetical protein n=1 Tax=Hyphococcus sp. TaxID=2038636 RepID=UPI003CCC3265
MKYILLLAAWLSVSACATVVRGTKDTAKFESAPEGAMVTTESQSEDMLGPFTCVAPCELELKRNRTWKVDFELEGYKPVSALLKPVVTGGGVAAGVGNALLGGIVGVGIDAGTGANMDLRPNPMVAQLAPVDSDVESTVVDAELYVEESPIDGDDSEVGEKSSGNGELKDGHMEPETGGDAEIDASQHDEAPPSSETLSSDDLMTDVSASAESYRYKPGEVAPNDKVANDLNRQQLESAIKQHSDQ